MFSSCKPRSPSTPSRRRLPRNKEESPIKTANRVCVALEIKIYVPSDHKDNTSVSHTVACGIEKLMMKDATTDDLLTGFFSIICTICPVYLELAKKVLGVLEFNPKCMKIPTEFSMVGWRVWSSVYKLGPGALLLAQLVYLPFRKDHSWSKVAKAAKVDKKLLVSKKRLQLLLTELDRSRCMSDILDAHVLLARSLSEGEDVIAVVFKTVAEQIPLSTLEYPKNPSIDWTGKQLLGNLASEGGSQLSLSTSAST